ncbi:MAG: cyclodeaminase/cyclohydrolase family protein [Spirochaetaceae bacterium]|jgi:formiminotetrahydrofolate cyclodeaminase|nr:cyclodeaminase/cyclohydrolase family protein [Spirochaetaceae bacterium]
MSISAKTIPDFVSVLASKAAVPGGGGASALVGAVGTALGNMVGSLTVGKKKYADVEPEIKRLQQECDRLQKEFLALIDKDAEDFEPLSKAYGLPANTDAEKAEKALVMEKCLKDACATPFEIMKKCAEAIKICEQFAAKGSKLAVSDAGVGVIFCKAALDGASLNVFINTKASADRAWADKINTDADALIKEYGALADKVFADVKGQLKK